MIERCRFCGKELTHTFLDLGMSPLSNSYIPLKDAEKGQMTYPLHVRVCDKCFLVQLGEFETPSDIFSDYAYFSSYSTSWLRHAQTYVADMMRDYNVGMHSKVVEIASNDGYLLQYFKSAGVEVLGVEPAKNVAAVAMEKGIPTVCKFFGVQTAQELREKQSADLIVGNNVLAHVPDINDFVEGMRILLADEGFITMEFPHLMRLMEQRQFDTIYHEHFSYLSFMTVKGIFAAHGLRMFNVQELETHGGSLRIFACHAEAAAHDEQPSVKAMLDKEAAYGLGKIDTYLHFSDAVYNVKYDLLSCLTGIKRKGAHIVGYGAAAKGNTLLNYCGIGHEYLDYVADVSPHKQGTLLPGSRISVVSPDEIRRTKPEYVLILPWNLQDEIMHDLDYIGEWGGAFIVAIPSVKVMATKQVHYGIVDGTRGGGQVGSKLHRPIITRLYASLSGNRRAA